MTKKLEDEITNANISFLPISKKGEVDKRSINVFLDQKGIMLQADIEKKIDKIGNQIFLKNNQVEKELFLENLSLFQWSLKKTFLKR